MREHGRKKNDGASARLFWYRIFSGERLFGIKRRSSLHLYGRRNVWYVYPYRKVQDARRKRDNDSKRIQGFWDFMDEGWKYYPYFYEKYVDAIRQVLWITKTVGDFEIVPVPKSSPDKRNTLEQVCRDIVERERFILGKALDGSDLLVRATALSPVHEGGIHSAGEIAQSMKVCRTPKSKRIILLDDLVFSGRTDLACRKLLKEAGAEEIFTVCMYGYNRPLGW